MWMWEYCNFFLNIVMIHPYYFFNVFLNLFFLSRKTTGWTLGFLHEGILVARFSLLFAHSSFFFNAFGEFPIIFQIINSIFGWFIFIIQPSYIFNLAIFQFPKSYYPSVPFSRQPFILLLILDISNLSEIFKFVKCSFQFSWIIYFLK